MKLFNMHNKYRSKYCAVICDQLATQVEEGLILIKKIKGFQIHVPPQTQTFRRSVDST